MTNPYLASSVLSALEDTGMLPNGDELDTTARLYAFMNREQRVYMTRLLLSARENYLVSEVDITITAGVLSYPLPTRAVGAKLQNVSLVDGEGKLFPMAKVSEATRYQFNASFGINGYEIRGNRLVLLGSPQGSSTLRLAYFRRANRIVPDEQAGEVQSINANAKTVTLVEVPTDGDGTAWTGTQTYDFIQGTPHFDVLGVDMSASLSASVLTFTDALPDDLAAGDFIALQGETPIINLPLECHDLLAQRACVKVLEAVGSPKLAAAKGMLDEMRDDVLSLIAPRVEATDDVLVNYDGPGWNRAHLRGFRRLR